MDSHIPVSLGILAVSFYAGFRAMRSIEGINSNTSEEKVKTSRQDLLSISFLTSPFVALIGVAFKSTEGAILAGGYCMGGMFASFAGRK